MEINHLGDTMLGVVAQVDMVEGRFVLLTTNAFSLDYGSQEDLPGVTLPTTSGTGALAHYIIHFEDDNRSLPFYQPEPHFDYALRYGFDQDTNAPFAATVYITKPGQQLGMTIPSGSGAVALGEGIYTLESNEYMYSASLAVPGATFAIADTATEGAANAGKPHYSTTQVIGEVIRYNSSTGRLTIKVYD